ncbi:hypothetical protein CLTEP_07270 [Clostridium tepidiprofundi DSM 19306]|uniref:Uncharacterized protein n=1 Tax=Clostridium tepidiprofundi DSM 19306 TaxID=1121338 RepID=A0A151B6A0_9CLOT|nr:pilus assembly PilX N-terminal domain-containing protein [Clostridium tepidiprofundi]KYH35323.1 hypothetical protein CLTEP_07270 [Clostridium tepidiprofundi DSM 19306]
MRALKKTKKGSSLALLLIIFSILAILGTAFMSAALGSFRMRKLNGTIKTNFYASEAGVDEAYAIIGKVVDKAIENGNNAVKSDESNLEKIIENERLKILADENYKSPYINADGSINEEKIKSYQNGIFKNTFKNYVKDNIKSEIEDSDNYKFNSDGTKPDVEVENTLSFADDKMNINVLSTFKHKDIEKKVEAEYEIKVPDYKSVYYIESNILNIPENSVFLNGISIDGDMNVFGGNVKINGNVFIKGSNVGSDGEIANAYEFESGLIIDGNKSDADKNISIRNNSDVNINGDLYTDQSIYINGINDNFHIDGTAYVRNAIISTVSKNSNLKVDGSLYTMDDLELNGNKSHVIISGGYYGMSDGSKSAMSDHSSSIIINAEDIGRTDGSSLKIEAQGEEDSIIIEGTSYIHLNDNNKYQTGESVSIKGNYKAYTHPLIDGNPVNKDGKSLKGDNIKFEYIDPLVLATKFKDDTDLNVFDKDKYFKAYSEDSNYNKDNFSKLNLGGNGIDINTKKILLNTGTVISGNKVIDGSYSVDKINENMAKLSELKRKIFFMGDDNVDSDTLRETNKLMYMVSKSDNLKGKVDFNSISNKFEGQIENNVVDNSKDVILLNNDSKTDYVFVGPDSNDNSLKKINSKNTGNSENNGSNKNNEKNNSTREIKINVNSSDGKFRGIIITAGDVYFCGKIKFKGTIISAGDLVFFDSNLKEIYYNEEYVKRLIAYNYGDFKDIFINNLPTYFNMEAETDIKADNSVKSDITRDKLISRKRWKIIK